MNPACTLPVRGLPVALLTGAALLLAGCGDTSKVGKVVPVSGKVTLAAEPLTAGMVTFTPDAGKGNTSKWIASGAIGADGAYTLLTETKTGAPPGWYKVSVSTSVPPSADMHVGQTPPKPVAINPMYNDPNRSGIAFEVKEGAAPDDYVIRLKK